MGSNDFGVNIVLNVNNNDFADIVGGKPKSKAKDVSESKGIEKETDNEKAQDAKRISNSIGGQVFINMLMTVPEVFVGLGIGFVDFLVGLAKKVFDRTGKKDEDTTLIGALTVGTMVEDPGPVPSISEEEVIDPISKPEEIQIDTIQDDTPSNVSITDEVKYDVDVQFTDNTETTAERLEKIDKMSISSPIEEWATAFETSAKKEKNIVEEQLEKPFDNLNTVLENVVKNKKVVDDLKSDILSWKGKIRKAKIKAGPFEPLGFSLTTGINGGGNNNNAVPLINKKP